MDRVNGADWFDIGGGKRGFRSQNAGAGIPGTEVTAAWLNGLQEEVAKVIEQAGLALDVNDNTQLWQALGRLPNGIPYYADTGAANAIAIAPEHAVATGRMLLVKIAAHNTGATTVARDGTAPEALTDVSGAALVANALRAGDFVVLVKTDAGWSLVWRYATEALPGWVRLATDAEAVAGVLTTKALHPHGLRAALDAYKPAPGKKPTHFNASRGAYSGFTNNTFVAVSGLATGAAQFEAGTSFDGSTLTIGAADAGLWFFSFLLIMSTEELVNRIYKNGVGVLALTNGDGYTGQTTFGRMVISAGPMVLAAGDLVTFRCYQRNAATDSKSITNVEIAGFRLS